jgi:hypothetical protein
MPNERFTCAAITLAVLVLVGGCETRRAPLGPETPDAAAAARFPGARLALGADVNQDLAALRRVTAAFHDFDNATAAGWSAQITVCLEDPTLGAQGFHYGNPAFIDGEANLLEPELLLYEPQSNGRFRLVGIEYIVPFTIVPATADPPTLFGQDFHQNFVFGVWALHVWVWRHNPSGLFADWNPQVSCAAAS